MSSLRERQKTFERVIYKEDMGQFQQWDMEELNGSASETKEKGTGFSPSEEVDSDWCRGKKQDRTAVLPTV